MAIRVTQPGGQLWNQEMQGTSGDASLWPTLEPMQVTLSDGQILSQVAL